MSVGRYFRVWDYREWARAEIFWKQAYWAKKGRLLYAKQTKLTLKYPKWISNVFSRFLGSQKHQIVWYFSESTMTQTALGELLLLIFCPTTVNKNPRALWRFEKFYCKQYTVLDIQLLLGCYWDTQKFWAIFHFHPSNASDFSV